jgi:transcriptional regulator with XRE-family HTH domain
MLSEDKYLKRFGSQVREARLEKGMSQELLAAESKVHRNYIGRLERGEACPSIFVVYKVAEVLNVTVDKLVCVQNN